MTFPVYLHVGGLTIHPHLVFETLAYAVGARLYFALRRGSGDVIDATTRWSIIGAAILGAGVGSRVLFWFEDPALTAAHWREVSYLLGGKTVVGALIGGLIGVELTKLVLGITRRTGDLFAAPLAFGIAIGRIGCFLTGIDDHTYGLPSNAPWAVDFGDGVMRHPTQLYESAFATLLGVWLWRQTGRPHREGRVFAAFMVAYMAWRVAIDSLKPELRLFLGLSALQVAALGVLVYYAAIWRRSFRDPHPQNAITKEGLR